MAHLNELEYGDLVAIRPTGEAMCNRCGAMLNAGTIYGFYKGVLNGIHLFEVFPWSCLSCRGVFTTHEVIEDGALNVTNEIQNI